MQLTFVFSYWIRLLCCSTRFTRFGIWSSRAGDLNWSPTAAIPQDHSNVNADTETDTDVHPPDCPGDADEADGRPVVDCAVFINDVDPQLYGGSGACHMPTMPVVRPRIQKMTMGTDCLPNV